jgi:hypothetical protein
MEPNQLSPSAFALSVKELSSWSQTTAYFEQLARQLGNPEPSKHSVKAHSKLPTGRWIQLGSQPSSAGLRPTPDRWH